MHDFLSLSPRGNLPVLAFGKADKAPLIGSPDILSHLTSLDSVSNEHGDWYRQATEFPLDELESSIKSEWFFMHRMMFKYRVQKVGHQINTQLNQRRELSTRTQVFYQVHRDQVGFDHLFLIIIDDEKMNRRLKWMQEPIRLTELKQRAREWMLQIENLLSTTTQPWITGDRLT